MRKIHLLSVMATCLVITGCCCKVSPAVEAARLKEFRRTSEGIVRDRAELQKIRLSKNF